MKENSHSGPGCGYTFGDTDVEAERLGVVAQVFGSSSRALLADAVGEAPSLAYDLGCGPGHTTRLVAEVTGALQTIGLDRSEAHVARAAAEACEGVRFLVHDVSRFPFPAGRADLIYCRLLLAHLADPVEAALSWTTQLDHGGLLVVDEIEWIESEHPVLEAHLCLVQSRVAHTGAHMCAGPLLAGLADGPRLRCRLRRVVELSVPTASAAAMFSMSLGTWGEQAVAASLCDRDELSELAAALAELRSSPATGQITWGLHQAAYEISVPAR
ncbi:MAG: class I SAM-dependent methyltransferase [Acidimicrobiales bacterium]